MGWIEGNPPAGFPNILNSRRRRCQGQRPKSPKRFLYAEILPVSLIPTAAQVVEVEPHHLKEPLVWVREHLGSSVNFQEEEGRPAAVGKCEHPIRRVSNFLADV